MVMTAAVLPIDILSPSWRCNKFGRISHKFLHIVSNRHGIDASSTGLREFQEFVLNSAKFNTEW